MGRSGENRVQGVKANVSQGAGPLALIALDLH